jgi:hypothetical protein
MKPRPPHPRCALCSDDGACAFHGAGSAADLARATIAALRTLGGMGLVQALTAAFAEIERALPPAVAPLLGPEASAAVQARFGALLDQDAFDVDDLRELAAVCLALALLTEKDQADAISDRSDRRAGRAGGR